MLSNSNCLIYFYQLHLANYSHAFDIFLSSLVRVQLCKDVRSDSDTKFNMYICVTAFSMEMSNGLLPFDYHHPLCAYCPSFSFFSPSSIHPHPLSLLLSVSLIAVPLMPPAQSQPRPAVGPQRFPVSSSCSSPSLSPHFLSLSTRLASLFVRAISLRQLDCLPWPNTVKANL